MKLKEYLKNNKIKNKDFAEMLGTSSKYVSAIVSGRKQIGKANAKKIEALTDGCCTKLELLYPEDY